MLEYFFNLQSTTRLIFIFSIILINILSFIFMKASCLKVFRKSNSFDLSMNKLRRITAYMVVPLNLISMGLAFLLFTPLVYYLSNDYCIPIAFAIAGALGLVLYFVRNIFIYSAVSKLSKLQDTRKEYLTRTLKIMLLFYIICSIAFFIMTFVQNLAVFEEKNKILVTAACSVILLLLASLISWKIMRKSLKSEPMEQGQLKEDIEYMARCIGYNKLSVQIIKDSRTNTGHAAVTSKENGTIFLSKEMLDKLSPEEIKAVVAHELGHLHNNDISKDTLAVLLGTGISFALLWWLKEYRYWYEFETILLILSVYFAVFYLIIMNALSRRHERKADEYVLEAGIPYEVFKRALIKLDNLDKVSYDFSKAEEVFLSHPTTAARFKHLAKLSDKLSNS